MLKNSREDWNKPIQELIRMMNEYCLERVVIEDETKEED